MPTASSSSRASRSPGSVEAIAELERRGIPFRVVTNFSQMHRETLAALVRARAGSPIDPDRIITAPSATAAYTAARPSRPAAVRARRRRTRAASSTASVSSPRTRPMRAGRRRSPRSSSAMPATTCRTGTWTSPSGSSGRRRAAGDAPQPVVAHPDGRDPRRGRRIVVGLEFATGERATILGKPSPDVFRQAVAGLAAPTSASGVAAIGVRDGRRRPAADVARGAAGRPARDPRPDRQDGPRRRPTVPPGGRGRGPGRDRPLAGRRRRRARLTATLPAPRPTHEAHHHDHRVQAAHQDHVRDPQRRQRGAARRLRGGRRPTARGRARRHHQNYIDGAWRDGDGHLRGALADRPRHRSWARSRRATAADVDDAVAAARAAQPAWAATPVAGARRDPPPGRPS